MNNELLIIDKSGKAWRCVDYRLAADDELFLTGTRLYVDRQRAGEVRYERHILEEVPSPYILREDAEALRLAAASVNLDGRFRSDGGLTVSGEVFVRAAKMAKLAAALEAFPPPEVQERFCASNRSQIEDTKHHTFHTVPTGLDTAEVAAALNNLTPTNKQED